MVERYNNFIVICNGTCYRVVYEVRGLFVEKNRLLCKGLLSKETMIHFGMQF